MGMPKALVDDWLARSVDALRSGGCSSVTVVLGARASEARELVPPGVAVIVADDWKSGMGASLRAGLASLSGPEAALVHLVDLPDVSAAVVARVLATGARLARASYSGVPGHPVLIGREHWAGVIETAAGDQGARAYLSVHDVELVECGDLATGADVDRRAE